VEKAALLYNKANILYGYLAKKISPFLIP